MIEVEDISFTYFSADRPAVRDLRFSIRKGEVFGFLGPSGAGKSTAQKILIGLLREYQGKVEILGKNLKEWRSDFYERIGVSFEFPNHFLKLTAIENLKYFSSLFQGTTLAPHDLLNLVDLEADADTLVAHFSKGMKNRLSVARSLVNDPELIFMDEPTAGLDPVNARRVRELIHSQSSLGKTVFLTTHDMVTADELCDRVAFLIDGQIHTIGEPRALRLEYGAPRVRVEYRDDGVVTNREFPLRGLGENQEFLALLCNTELQTIHTMEATLEDVFVKVTGRSLI